MIPYPPIQSLAPAVPRKRKGTKAICLFRMFFSLIRRIMPAPKAAVKAVIRIPMVSQNPRDIPMTIVRIPSPQPTAPPDNFQNDSSAIPGMQPAAVRRSSALISLFSKVTSAAPYLATRLRYTAIFQTDISFSFQSCMLHIPSIHMCIIHFTVTLFSFTPRTGSQIPCFGFFHHRYMPCQATAVCSAVITTA